MSSLRPAKDIYISGEKLNISLVISFYFMFWCSSPILNRLNIVNKQHSEDLREAFKNVLADFVR